MSELKELPKGWKWKKLGEVCKTTSGGTPNRGNKEYYDGNIPWVKSGELDKGLILDTEEKISELAIKKSSAKIFPKGTLLIALYGATIGKLAFLGVDASTNQAICGIYENDVLDSKYLYHYLFNKKQKLVDQGIGGAQPNISQTILKNLDIPLPPLPTQQAIVSKIEELFSELDKGVENLKTAQQQLKVYRQSVLKWAFEGKLTRLNHDSIDLPDETDLAMVAEPQEVYLSKKHQGNQEYPKNHGADKEGLPAGWREVVLGEVLKVSSGKGLKVNELKGGEYNVYGGNGINGKHSEYFLDEQKLIIGRVGVKCGVTHITKTKSWVTDNALIVDFKEVGSDLMFYKLKLEFENLNKLSVSTAQPVISGSKIYSYSVIIPPIEQQTQIVQEIESRLSVADKMEETIHQSLLHAESLRQSILKKAFEGELVR